ncbi:MAG: DMT family transporter, partial [bacterium]|nr:DMT family transporter [bacterium]
LALLAAFSFGSSTVFGKFAVRKVSFETATLTRFLLTAGIMFVVLLLSQLLLSFGVAIPYKGFAGFSDVGLSHLTVFIIIVFTTGSGATLLYYFGLKRVMASHATIYELTFPISAILFEYVIHEKLLDLWQFLGAGLILVAITMISGAGNKKESK